MLFTPVKIGQLIVAGRLFKTATAETRASADGFVTGELIDFYVPIAAGGTPLIITGNLYVAPEGKSAPRQIGADSDDKVPGLRQLVDAVHEYGAKIFAQLNHCGRQVVPRLAGLSEAVSASDVKDLITGTRPRPLTTTEITRIVQQFADGAGRCQHAGFDGIQIHAAHGYLLGQFLTPYTNRRADDFGGEPRRRTKLLCDVFRAIRSRVGPAFPVMLKLNGSDWLPLRAGLKTAALAEIAVVMEAEGADAIEVSVGHYESGFPMVRGRFGRCLSNMVQGSMQYLATPRRVLSQTFRPLMTLACNIIWSPREGYNLDYARQFKSKLSIPVVCVGGFLTREAMTRAIEQGHCDAISVGRGLIADPFLYHHLRQNIRGPRCNDCNACVGHIGTKPLDCYHPRIRAEKDAMLASMNHRPEQPRPTS